MNKIDVYDFTKKHKNDYQSNGHMVSELGVFLFLDIILEERPK